MSKKEERLNRLIEILKKQNGATIRDLAQVLDVSEMTVRRDMDTLKAKNVILDIPGAAVLNTQYAHDKEKMRISSPWRLVPMQRKRNERKVCRIPDTAG